MQHIKIIMRQYKLENILVPKIRELLKKEKLTKEEIKLQDVLIDKFLEMRYSNYRS